MLKILMLLFFVTTPPARAAILSNCLSWLTGPEGTITANIDDYEHIDLENINPSTLETLLEKPVVFRVPESRGQGRYRPYVGPVIFYQPTNFSKNRRRIIKEVMWSAANSDLYGEILFTSKSGATHESIIGEFEDLVDGELVDPQNIKRIEIFLSHSDSSLMGAAPLSAEQAFANRVADDFENNWHATPEVHLYSIADSPSGRLIGHYSVQR